MSMTPEELASTCIALVKVKSEAKSATESHKDSFKVAAKVLCAVKENLVKSQRARLVPMNRTVKEHFEFITGNKGVNLSGHCYSLADAFSVYVTSGKIPESDWDLASANALETAGRIHAEVVDKGGLAHDAVDKAAALLKVRGDGYQKTLKGILEGLKSPKKLSEEDVRSFLLRAFADGQAEVVSCELAAEMVAMRDRKEADWFRHRIHNHMTTGLSNLGTPEEIHEWLTKPAPNTPPPASEKPATPAQPETPAAPAPQTPPPAPETPATPTPAPAVETTATIPVESAPEPETPASVPVTAATEKPDLMAWAKTNYPDPNCSDDGWNEFVGDSVQPFFDVNGRLPSSPEELDAFMESQLAEEKLAESATS